MTERFPRVSALIDSLPRELNKNLALFLDFDGTLVPIAPRPEQALLERSTRKLLKSLSSLIPVAIISGRSLIDIRKQVRLIGVTYAGNHGLEIYNRHFRYTLKNASRWRGVLQKSARRLRTDLEKIPGILLENKGYTISVHYRLAGKESRRKARSVLGKHLNPLLQQGLVRVTTGKAVWEIRPPVVWNKGEAVLWILRQPPFRGRWPLYFGDDETDQDAFQAIRRLGAGVLVGGERKGFAHFTLESPREVHRVLKEILDRLSAKASGG